MVQFLYDILLDESLKRKRTKSATITTPLHFLDTGIYVVSYITGKTLVKDLQRYHTVEGDFVEKLITEPVYIEEKKHLVYEPHTGTALYLHSDSPQTIKEKPNFLGPQLDAKETALLEKILLKNQNLEYYEQRDFIRTNRIQLCGTRELEAYEINNANYSFANRVIQDLKKIEWSLDFYNGLLQEAHGRRKSERDERSLNRLRSAVKTLKNESMKYNEKAEQIIEMVTKSNKCKI